MAERVVLTLAVLIGLVLGGDAIAATAVQVKPECLAAIASASVEDAYRVIPEEKPVPGQKEVMAPAPKEVQLGYRVAVKVTGLDKLVKDCENLSLILFLNGHPISALKPYPPTDPRDGILRFDLKRTEASRAAWTAILGKPDTGPRDLQLSVGFEELYPLKAASGKSLPVLKLDVIQNRWFMIWLLVFALMFFGFLVGAYRSNIIRDGNPIAAGSAKYRGTYSLSKTQGAWWFFVIIAAYLLIVLVTGDFSSSINSTAIILLGIGAGTVLGSAAIDASKKTEEALKQEQQDITTTRQRISDLESRLTALQAGGVPADGRSKSDLENEKAELESLYRKLTRQSENFITDILSDANGMNFHRFQIAAWTLVLSIIFIKEVYENLAMPEFNPTLLGLLGLSAGTYLGLKIPEPTTPKK